MKLTRESLDDIRKILREASNDSLQAKIEKAIFYVNEADTFKKSYPCRIPIALSITITGEVEAEESLLAEQEKISKLWGKILNLN